jgi:hypothetical protein
MAKIVRSSLLEMELVHKQEAMEVLELEQALAMSLLAEEERLEMCREEAKQQRAAGIGGGIGGRRGPPGGQELLPHGLQGLGRHRLQGGMLA